jgi:hypothetical protein
MSIGEGKQKVPNDVTRKGLLLKALERWENEGGRTLAWPIRADDRGAADHRKSEGSQLSAPHEASAVDALAPRKK